MEGPGSPPYGRLAPPPPPPPPSSSTQSDPDVHLVQTVNVDQGYEDGKLTRIEQRQDTLRDARDELIGSRFRLKARRRELCNVREDAGNIAGSAFSSIQKFLIQQNIRLPEPIANAFAEASARRDMLGQLDTEYDEAEQDYNLLEWEYTKTETLFVEEFTGDKLAKSLTDAAEFEQVEQATQARSSQLQYFTRSSIGAFETAVSSTSLDLGEEASTQDVVGHSNMWTPPGGLLEDQVTTTWPEYFVVSPSEDVPNNSVPEDSRLFPRSFSESEIGQAHLTWSKTCKRIDFWLLQILSTSPYQRAQLRAQLSEETLDDKTWWELVKQHWPTKSPEDFLFSTGDSTMSYADATQPISLSTEQPILETPASGRNESAIEMNNMLFHHKFDLEHMAEDSFPATLGPTDFVEAGTALEIPKVTVQEPEQEEAFSDFPIAIVQGINQSDIGSTENKDEHRVEDRPQQHEDGEEHQHSTEGNQRMPSELNQGEENRYDNPGQTLIVPVARVSLLSQESETCSQSSVSIPGRQTPVSNSPNNLLHPGYVKEPPSPPKTRPSSPETRRQCPFAQFFRTDALEGWGYILRLTPFPACSCEEKCLHSSASTSFVSTPSSQARLPGPSSDELFD
jgi:hypothetical protein